MQIAKVIGNVVSTRKDETLVGFSLLVLEVERPGSDAPTGQRVVAIDSLGAGIGERVLFVSGGAARVNLGTKAPVDAAIVGIIDTVDTV